MREWTWREASTNGPTAVAAINCTGPDTPGFGFIVPLAEAPFITDACNAAEQRAAVTNVTMHPAPAWTLTAEIP